MEFLIFAVGLLVGGAAAHAWRGRRLAGMKSTPGPGPGSTEVPSPPADELPRDRLFRLKREIEAQDDRIQHPDDLLALPEFQEGTALLGTEAFSAAEVLEHLGSGGYVLPSMAARALPARADMDPASVLAATSSFGGYPLRFVLEYLQAQQDAQWLPALLRHAREWWWSAQGVRQRLRGLLAWAEDKSPWDQPANFSDLDDGVLEEQREALAHFASPLLAAHLLRIDAELAQRRERRVLSGFGRLPTLPLSRPRFTHPELERQVEHVLERLQGGTRGPLLVSGEHGVGKSTLVDAVTERLLDAGWLVFEAGGAEILAGQKYTGELEGRVREMLAVLDRAKALWRVPDFFDLLHKGAHSQDPRGILDLVLPAIERGELLLVGEIAPRQLAQLLVVRPAVRHLFEVVLLQPASDLVLDDIGSQWARSAAAKAQCDVADQRTLAEAKRMAAQFFPEQHEPGRLLRLLDEALHAAMAHEPPALPLQPDQVLEAVARRSGLPLQVIDDRESLQVASVQAFFRERVIGQDEAVEALVDRIAMLKAGLVDATRPIGVFLFAGPTGTGKTELAKTLGELLFGSPERLLRLDMSEYQSEEAAWRLLGDSEGGSRSLTSRIREQPFSVVLLDEFEKAHPKIWDLFLQVFDDARLTDRNGNTADFRHSIIILTTNVGSTLARSAGPGFTATAGSYSRNTVERALHDTFRREFINRLDRVVLFKPLDRSLMREILHKELRRTLQRRGLRNREWAVEWEPSAIEFLLDRGFTPDLGARPLRRAIEHHLLAPLARTIVEHRVPQGDQFLFVRSDGEGLDVEFVDPDATPGPPPSTRMADAGTADLRDLVGAPDDLPAGAIARLEEKLAALTAQVEDAAWCSARDEDFARMADGGFWSSPSRFEVLDRIERRDRIGNAIDTGNKLARRLQGATGAGFAARLAQLLFLLEPAIASVREHRPQDALLRVCVSGADRVRLDEVRPWWQAILAMYLAWARKRNMKVEVLEQDPLVCEAWFAISGFGALELLSPETGLHVLEGDQEDGTTRRLSLQVSATPDLPGVQRRRPATDADLRVVRRYRWEPAPLVRDSLRGWRTGRIDRVLGGDFDVIPAEG